MDREDYLVAAEMGEAAATACLPDEPSEEFVSDTMADPVGVQPEAAEPQTVDEHGDDPGITPARIIEALLFASDTPLSANRLAELSGIGSVKAVRQHVAELNETYAAAGLSFRVDEIAKGYQLLTLPAYAPWLAKLNQQRAQGRLTGAALETLSIVAYKQPIIRADVEAIRGVACGEVINRLREMGLVKIVGRAEIVGRPMLYGTTKKFLDVFGLSDLDDLPPMEALKLKPARPRTDAAEPEESAGETRVAAAGA